VTPEQVADGIVDGLRHPRFAIWVPRAMGVMALGLSAVPYGIRRGRLEPRYFFGRRFFVVLTFWASKPVTRASIAWRSRSSTAP
jgi:hypothetical protein